MSQPISLCWLRRDMRLHDNAALYHALKSGNPVLVLFIYDRDILDQLDDKRDRRVEFINNQVASLQEQLTGMGSTILARYGRPIDVFSQLIQEFEVAEVYTNYDYETYAKTRDRAVAGMLAEHGIGFNGDYKDTTLLDRDEVRSGSGGTYTVFTPYSKNWLSKLEDPACLASYPTEDHFNQFHKTSSQAVPSLAEMGFEPVGDAFPKPSVGNALLKTYEKTRDYPAQPGTSELSIHLRFGTISIRDLARQAQANNDTFLKELAWRDFYFQVLEHFPHVEHNSFRREYDNIQWRNNEAEFEKWCQGQTGYPLVDAGMRQLNEIGWMHNRVRMVTASFCVKHLLIDWRWGEAYFGKKLRDYDLSANNGGWQWAAGSGTDAAPYFRVFNPALQAQKFDPKGEYIRKWVPEFNSLDYAKPIVEHTFARQRVLDVYQQGLKKA
ncbi:MAG: deoxyribodipyrimidine photo-lyase [Bacteroidetes bacterium]|nr:deoxyribodipyrimidine photo-lyase [Fibrella sp.]